MSNFSSLNFPELGFEYVSPSPMFYKMFKESFYYSLILIDDDWTLTIYDFRNNEERGIDKKNLPASHPDNLKLVKALKVFDYNNLKTVVGSFKMK